MTQPRRFIARRALSLAALLLSSLLLHGGSCDGNDPVNSVGPSCDVELTGPGELLMGEPGMYVLVLGSSWSTGTSATYSVSPNENVELELDTPDADVEATFGQPGTYVLVATVDAETGEGAICEAATASITIVVSAPAGSEVPTGTFASPAGKPDGITSVDSEGWQQALQTDHAVVVATERGTTIIDLITRQEVPGASKLSAEPLDVPPLGAILTGDPAEAQQPKLIQFGGSGVQVFWWDTLSDTWFPGLDLVENQFPPVFDVTPFGDGTPGGCFFNGIRTIREYVWSDDLGFYDNITRDTLPLPEDPRSAVCDSPGGSVLLITEGSPGKLWLWDDTGGSYLLTEIGDVGDDPRRIRRRGDLVVVTSFGSNEISIVQWDGAGAVVASTPFDLPPECSQPAHGAWIGDANESLIVSCFGSDNLYVARRTP